MAKFLYLATIFLIIGLSLAHHKNDAPWYYNFLRPFITRTSVCGNNGTEALYLNKTLTLLNNFQTNATYNFVLQLQSLNLVSYIKNPINQGLLFSNCSVFVVGLQTAKLADEAAERARKQIGLDIYLRIRQVPRDVTGSNGPNDMDSSEVYHGRH